MEKETEHTLMVTPIDHEKLAKHIEEVWKPEPNQTYRTENCALVYENVMTDDECCYWIINKKAHKNKIQFVHSVPVRVLTTTVDGAFYPMTPSFYVDLAIEDLKPYMKEEVSLREYMDRRYNYNPRITKNMRDLLKEINSQPPDVEK